jgi:transcriptional regulator with XRE-family HTH domain
MAFATRLKALRSQAGFTQEVLAAAAGVGREAIARLELGLREPTWATVQALAVALGVSVEAFTESAQPTPAPKKRAAKKPKRGS